MKNLPKGVHEKHGSYYRVKQNKWIKLCSVKDGLPGVYKAMAELLKPEPTSDSMPALVQLWMDEVSAVHSVKLQANDRYQTKTIADSFVDFRAEQVKPSDVIRFLKPFRVKPRTHNAYRSMLSELMRFAEEKDTRQPGTNPVAAIKTMPLRSRSRYITDSELRRIKIGGIYGDDGKRTRSGMMLCALIDLAYLTGQRIGDLLMLQWSQVGHAGILFAPAKIEGSTGQQVLIKWSPKLEAVIGRIKAMKKRHIKFVITNQSGQPYTYFGASSAWMRAVKRAQVPDCHFHDIRAKALTDTDELHGIGAAQRQGAHSTQTQTAGYVRNKKPVAAGATR